MTNIDIGSMINIGKVVADELNKQAAKDSTKLASTDVPKVEPPVTKAVENAINETVQAVIENQTNQEPLWKSRVMRGAVWTIITTAYLAYNDFYDGSPPTMEALGGYVSAIGGALFVIYGRITNKAAPAI